MEQRHSKYKARFKNIERFLSHLKLQPHSTWPRNQRQHIVQSLENRTAAAAGPPTPPVPAPSLSIINVSPSSPAKHWQFWQQQENWVAGKAPTPQAFGGKQEELEGCLLQMDNFFTITLITNESQKLAYVGLCIRREVLEWWKANRHRHHTWVGVKEAIKTYYGNHHQADQA